MILNFILLFLGSVLLFSLLIPKPQIEDAKAQEFNENGFPQASENAPIPYLIGKTRLESPNTLFAGGFRTEAIKERIRTGLFSKKTIVTGYRYYLTIDLGLCLGGSDDCTLNEVWMDSKLLWRGAITGNDAAVSFGDAELFGGHKNGGGFVTTGKFYSGSFSQSVNGVVAGLTGGLYGDLDPPPYNGVCHIVLEDAYIGEQPQLRKIAFVVSRFTNNLGLADGDEIIDSAEIWASTNLAEATYTVLTDNWGGLGASPDDLDIPEFLAAANTFFAESNGASGVVQNATDGATVLKQMMKQGDFLLAIKPSTNKVYPKLLRDDFDVGTLPVFGPSTISEVKKYSQTLWSELVSEVKVGFKNPDNNFQDTTAIAQDLAIANITNGRVKSVSVNMPFCKSTGLANDIAGRELNQLSQTLVYASLTVNRNAFQLLPGAVFKWTWPDYQITEMVMRVKEYQEGDDDDPEIQVDVVRDTYGNFSNAFAAPIPGPSVDLTDLPVAVSSFGYFDAPEYVANALTLSPDLGLDASYIAILPTPGNVFSVSLSATIDGDVMFQEQPFPVNGILSATIDEFDNFDTLVIPSLTITGVDTARLDEFGNGGTASIRAGDQFIWCNGEMLGYQTFTDNTGGSITLNNVHRALLNTKQQTLTAGDTIYLFNIYSLTSEAPVLSSTSPASVLLIPSSGVVTLDPAFLTPSNVTLLNAVDKPDPPHLTLIDGLRVISPDDASTVTVTWNIRDHQLGTVQLPGDADDALPAGITWEIEIYNITVGGGAIYTQTGIATDSASVTLPVVGAPDLIELRVYSRINGLKSIYYDPYRFVVNSPIFGSLFTNTNYFGSNDLISDAIIDGALFTNTNYFGTNSLAVNNTLLGSLFTNTNTFGTNEVIITNTIVNVTFTNTNYFGTNEVQVPPPTEAVNVSNMSRFTFVEMDAGLVSIANLNRFTVTVVDEPISVIGFQRFTIVEV